MALVVNDRVKETSTTTGQGTLNLAGASQDFITFVAGIGTTNTTYYCIENTGTGEFEVGIGTVTDATPDTLSRDTVISNSAGNTSKIDFAAGEKNVFCTMPAKRTISPVMTATGFVVTHASTLDQDQTMDSGVLAGPVTITGTITATGTLVII
jgi:phage baseplate assembly protein gpV